MGLKNEAVEAQASVHGYQRCHVALALEALDESDGQDLRELIDDESVMATVIRDVLAKRKIEVNVDSIRRARKKNGKRECKWCRENL